MFRNNITHEYPICHICPSMFTSYQKMTAPQHYFQFQSMMQIKQCWKATGEVFVK